MSKAFIYLFFRQFISNQIILTIIGNERETIEIGKQMILFTRVNKTLSFGFSFKTKFQWQFQITII
jgi:hypothetical protein